MATMTVSLPEQMKDWIETQVSKGEFASSSDYVRDLVRRDREKRDREHYEKQYTIEELRELVAESRASGISNRTVEEIFHEAVEVARSRGTLRE